MIVRFWVIETLLNKLMQTFSSEMFPMIFLAIVLCVVHTNACGFLINVHASHWM